MNYYIYLFFIISIHSCIIDIISTVSYNSAEQARPGKYNNFKQINIISF